MCTVVSGKLFHSLVARERDTWVGETLTVTKLCYTQGPGCKNGQLLSRVGHPGCLLCLLDFQYPLTLCNALWTSLSERLPWWVGPSPAKPSQAQDIRRTQIAPTWQACRHLSSYS